MQVWIVVIGLLALAVIFLFISLFLKDNNNDEEIDELSESLLELNREIYYLKKKIQELEGTPKVIQTPTNFEAEPLYAAPAPTPPVSTPSFTAETTTFETPIVEETPTDSKRLHNITKQHIITLYSHGSTLEEITEQLNVPLTTVQLVVDNYFETDPK